MVARLVRDQEVAGSNPVVPTTFYTSGYDNLIRYKRFAGIEVTANIGAWRSLVAHLAWDQGVAGSNPAAPTTYAGVAQW